MLVPPRNLTIWKTLIQRSTMDLLTCQLHPQRQPPSIEEGTAHNPIFLSDVPNTPVTVQPTQLPVRIERQRGFANEIQNSPEYVIETLFE